MSKLALMMSHDAKPLNALNSKYLRKQVVAIDIFHFHKSLLEGFEKKELHQVKDDITELQEYSVALQHAANANFFEDISMHISNDDFIAFQHHLADVLTKQDLNSRLQCAHESICSFKQNRGLQNKDANNRHMQNILKNEHCGLNLLVTHLEKMKQSLDAIDQKHHELLKSSLPIDVKAALEMNYANKLQQLFRMYTHQKTILQNLAAHFLALAKKTL